MGTMFLGSAAGVTSTRGGPRVDASKFRHIFDMKLSLLDICDILALGCFTPAAAR